MNWDEEEQEYTLSSGRQVYANNGIIGLGPGPDDLVTEGYDGSMEVDPTYLWVEADEVWTPAERREIADAMIQRWEAWARR